MTSNSKFVLGRVVGFHGLSGEVKIDLSTNNSDLVTKIENVTAVLTNKEEQLLQVKSLRVKGKTLILTFVGFADRTAVEPFLNAELSVDRAQLNELANDEWWISDLVGLSVYTTTGKLVGSVVSVIDGHTSIIEIKPEGESVKTILVPFVNQLIPTVSIKDKRIEVVDLEGLLEPQ